MTTLKETLTTIHSLIAEDMLEVLRTGVIVPPTEEGGSATARRPNAQEWNAIIKFLKDNGVDRLPSEAPGADDPFTLLLQKAKERTRLEPVAQ